MGAVKVPWDTCRECTSSNEAVGYPYGIEVGLGYTARISALPVWKFRTVFPLPQCNIIRNNCERIYEKKLKCVVIK